MIERYTLPEMAHIWSDETKLSKWLEVELAALEAQEELGYVPSGVTADVRSKARFDIDKMLELEKELKHDVIAFLTTVNESVGENGRFIHKGMTSSDMIDTALALQLAQAIEHLLGRLGTLTEMTWALACREKKTPTIGRSHGIHAEPTTFGLKVLVWYESLLRGKQRLLDSLDAVKVGQISGPVGTYSAIEPEVERLTCEKLGLKPARVSTQIIERDTHAALLSNMALLASSIENIAVEIRHLQRTEVLEAEEPFTKGQKGSSAMPHKRNPVGSENLTGLARMIRGYAQPMMENIALWHERDISHSSVERIVFPDAFILMDYMLNRMNTILSGLIVYPDTMRKNLFHKGGLVFSQQVLIALIDKGMSREEAYAVIQRNAMAAWEAPDGNFKVNLKADPDVSNHLSDTDIDNCFDLDRALRHVDSIFLRFEAQPSLREAATCC